MKRFTVIISEQVSYEVTADDADHAEELVFALRDTEPGSPGGAKDGVRETRGVTIWEVAPGKPVDDSATFVCGTGW